jgi:hypothetical protein
VSHNFPNLLPHTIPPPALVVIVSNDIYVAQRTEVRTVDMVIPQRAEN